MSQHEAVLFANEAFYQAFSNCDFKAMDEVWASDAPVACLHPGWHPLTDRKSVLESWDGLFRNGGSGKVQCRNPHVCLYGDTAVVVCFESLQDIFLVATNVFVRVGNGWKMAHHQAGPTNFSPPSQPVEAPRRVH